MTTQINVWPMCVAVRFFYLSQVSVRGIWEYGQNSGNPDLVGKKIKVYHEYEGASRIIRLKDHQLASRWQTVITRHGLNTAVFML